MEEDVTNDNERPVKRARLFIARQACENCRIKKTRCDEDRPCKPCKVAGITCEYGERKATKNEVSLGMILHKLERLDAKVDQLTRHEERPPASLPAESPVEAVSVTKGSPISFSAHLMLDWPAIRDLIPPSLSVSRGDYALKLEDNRTGLPLMSHPTNLSDLSISTVRDLSDAYFATFNLTMPVLDRQLYFQRTLGTAINGGFGYDADSCVVLTTMALGCFGSDALSGRQSEDVPGLIFFNEARKRMGFLECENSMEICQFYLLAASYYGQLVRPVDCWSMTMRASVCCLRFWDNPPDMDEWTLDMFSRMFWVTVMFQTVLTQELIGLPTSKIRDLEDRVPLPRFVPYWTALSEGEDESFFHYHFLSQIAHRIFLTRVYNSIYHTSPSGDYPNVALARELYHQLDQWRSRLPPGLRFDDETPIPDPAVLTNVLVVSWLHARYAVAKYHLGRPFLYKALHHPFAMTEHDRQRCKETLEVILPWGEIMHNITGVRSCVPLAFSLCSQLFGQLLLVYAFRHGRDSSLQELLPEDWEVWTAFAVRTLQEFAATSPTVARDAEIAAKLFPGS